MTTFSETRKTSAAYQAALLIHTEGPMSAADLYSRVSFGDTADGRRFTMERAIRAGWLVNDYGLIDITDDARDFMDSEAPKAIKGMGSFATGPTINMLTRPPLSRKYLTNSRGIRQDQPEWSRRPEGFTLRTVA